ncbi:MAG: STAS domain-containing protein [Planctomycetaceae bacterium]
MTVSMSTSFYVEQLRDVTVVCFTCRTITEVNFDVISEELLEFADLVTLDRPVQVIAELLAIREVDAIGLEVLRAFHQTIHDAGGRLVMCRVQPSVNAAIRSADLPCEIFGSRSEAIWSF